VGPNRRKTDAARDDKSGTVGLMVFGKGNHKSASCTVLACFTVDSTSSSGKKKGKQHIKFDILYFCNFHEKGSNDLPLNTEAKSVLHKGR